MDPFEFGEKLFKTLLRGPIGENLAAFKEAERQYELLKTTPDQMIIVELSVLSKSQDVGVRQITATMMNKDVMAKSSTIYSLLPDGMRTNFNNAIITLMNTETQENVLKVYSGIVQRMYEKLVDSNIDATFIMNAIFTWIQSGDENHRVKAFEILNEGVIYDQTDELFNRYVPQYMQLMEYGISQNNPIWLRDVFKLFVVTAIAASAEENEQLLKQVMVAFTPFIQLTKTLIQSTQDETLVSDILNSYDMLFMDVDEVDPNQIMTIIEMVTPICLNTSLNDELRTMAMELLITIAENDPKLLKKTPDTANALLNIIALYISSVQVTNEWLNSIDDDDQLIYYSEGCSALSRIVDSFGSSFIYKYIKAHETELLNGLWQQRHVYLQFIYKLIISPSKKLKKQFEVILRNVVKFFQDESPRNRHLSMVICNKLTTLDKKMAETNMPMIMTFVSKLMSDQVPRVVSRACDFVSSLLDNFKKEILQPYLKPILIQLIALVQTNQKDVVSEAVCAISFIAIRLKKDFIEYYQPTIEIMKKVLETLGINEELFEVKGRIIECLSVIGMNLEENYCNECAQLIFTEVDKVLKIPDLKIENSIFGFVETSFTRIAEILKERFVQYLPTVLQIVLRRCKMNIICTEEDIESNRVNENDVSYVKVENHSFTVHTALAEEKRNAINAIGDFANDLEFHFYPFVQTCLETILPIVKDTYDEELRTAATKTVYRLLKSFYLGKCKECNSEQIAKQQVAPVFYTCINEICGSISIERYVDTITKNLVFLDEIISILADNSMSEEIIGIIATTMKTLFEDAVRRLSLDEKKFQSYERRKLQEEDDDDDDSDEEMEDSIKENRRIELKLRVQFRRLLSILSKYQPTPMTPAFQTILLPSINEALALNNPPAVQKLVTMFCESLMTTFATDSNNPTLIKQLVLRFIERCNTNDFTESVLINLAVLIQYPIVQENVIQISQICQRLFPLKLTQPSLYNVAIMLFGKCLVVDERLCNESILVNFMNVLPIDNFFDESLSILFSLITKKHIPINIHTMKRVMDILVIIINNSGLDEITSLTKEIIQFHMKQWAQQNPTEFGTIYGQYSQEQQQGINEMCGLK